MADREAVLTETLKLHDLYYGNQHCDRKYVQVCSKFQGLLFEAAKNLREKSNGRNARTDH